MKFKYNKFLTQKKKTNNLKKLNYLHTFALICFIKLVEIYQKKFNKYSFEYGSSLLKILQNLRFF